MMTDLVMSSKCLKNLCLVSFFIGDKDLKYSIDLSPSFKQKKNTNAKTKNCKIRSGMLRTIFPRAVTNPAMSFARESLTELTIVEEISGRDKKVGNCPAIIFYHGQKFPRQLSVQLTILLRNSLRDLLLPLEILFLTFQTLFCSFLFLHLCSSFA